MSVEERVLAAIIGETNFDDINVQQAMLTLSEDCFENYDYREIFKLIKLFFTTKEPIDFISLEPSVNNEQFDVFREIAGRSIYISTDGLEDDVNSLLKRRLQRILGHNLSQLLHDFQKEKIPLVACETAVTGCLNISRIALGNSQHVFTSEQLAEQFLSGTVPETIIIPTGIDIIDNQNGGGFKNKSLITIAGRPSTGKTCFATYLAQKLATNHPKKHVLFYSLEMSAQDVYGMQLTAIGGKQFKKLQKDELNRAISGSLAAPFTIDEKTLASIDYIETSARIVNTRNPIGVLVVDYLSIVQNAGKFESNALRQADITARLASLAKEFDCIVIALSQVNRDYAQRKDKVPITSDAADSSGSERNSAYWLAIHRPALDDNADAYMNNVFIVKCRKNRWVDKLWTAYFAFNEATFGKMDQHLLHAIPAPQSRADKYKGFKDEG